MVAVPTLWATVGQVRRRRGVRVAEVETTSPPALQWAEDDPTILGLGNQVLLPLKEGPRELYDEALGQAIELSELKAAIDSMAQNKALGLDGLPVEFYSAFVTTLGPRLVDMYEAARSVGTVPLPSREALIVPLLKPRKPPAKVTSYQPLSMLSVDYKILTTRLLPHMHRLIHADQARFIPGRCTAINIRQLFSLLEDSTYNKTEAVIFAVNFE
ncbi:hypothetical protein NDU88_009391 [Pleurodeles waltl]|uniref:Reverse transcriptase domain-containing protein n=1 Tax=Pleurodeles waltl TaxID=8319 RepID=A0AAV7QV54_PLEWA|nr:hypothetical protein NDU88_009391 [Pleurodeles waltl]